MTDRHRTNGRTDEWTDRGDSRNSVVDVLFEKGNEGKTAQIVRAVYFYGIREYPFRNSFGFWTSFRKSFVDQNLKLSARIFII